MAQLIMLDHSLAKVGGHHYEYALNVLRAAESAGREIVVAANVKFERAEDFGARWRVLSVFRRTAYNEFNVFTASAKAGRMVDFDFRWDEPPPPRATWRQRWAHKLNWRNLFREHRHRMRAAWKAGRKRWDLIDECVSDCLRAFQSIELGEDDLVFVPTLTEFDLVWIAQFLKTERRFSRVPWHLQFHFNFLEGREPDYVEQAGRLGQMRRHFQWHMSHLSTDCLRLYTTTEQLADQYNRLNVGNFRCLPYPVNPDLQVKQRAARQPLRVVSAGCIRAEKGYDRLGPLIAALWKEHLVTRRLQLVVQTDGSEFCVTLPDGRPVPLCEGPQVDHLGDEPVIAVRAPLEVSEYTKLIGSADIGMFLYDSDRYYTRCSGVLVEMLASGVPVIVPAASWLSEQIAEPIAEHLDGLLQQSAVLQAWPLKDLRWHAAGDSSPRHLRVEGIVVDGEQRALTATIDVPEGAAGLMAELVPGPHWTTGSYVRLSAELLDQEGEVLNTQAVVVGRRNLSQTIPAMIRITPKARHVRLRLQNAFRKDLLSIDSGTIHFLRSRAAGSLPAGARGLIAANADQVPALLADMAENYSHYRATAAAFAPHWMHEHHPQRTMEILLGGDACGVHRLRQAA